MSQRRFLPAVIFAWVIGSAFSALSSHGLAAEPTRNAEELPVVGDAMQNKAIEAIAGYYYPVPDLADLELLKLGVPRELVESTDWLNKSFEEKIRQCVLMAENHEKGEGKKFLTILTQNLAKELGPIIKGNATASGGLIALATKEPISPTKQLSTPIKFKRFGTEKPPTLPSDLEAETKVISKVISTTFPIGHPVEFLQKYCSIETNNEAMDIVRKHSTMHARIKIALLQPQTKNIDQFIRKVTKDLHTAYGDIIATDPVLARYLQDDSEKAQVQIIPPKEVERPPSVGKSSSSSTDEWELKLKTYSTDELRRFENQSTDWTPTESPLPNWPSKIRMANGAGGNMAVSGNEANSPRSKRAVSVPVDYPDDLKSIIDRMARTSDDKRVMSPDYSLTYDDLLPPIVEARKRSLYDQLAEQHLNSLPPDIRQQLSVNKLKGTPNPETAVTRARSFSQLTGFHRVGGGDFQKPSDDQPGEHRWVSKLETDLFAWPMPTKQR